MSPVEKALAGNYWIPEFLIVGKGVGKCVLLLEKVIRWGGLKERTVRHVLIEV